jgi:hypothetical protein
MQEQSVKLEEAKEQRKESVPQPTVWKETMKITIDKQVNHQFRMEWNEITRNYYN